MENISYKNKNMDISLRVNDLLSRMTLEEKAGQLCLMDGRKDPQKWVSEKFAGALLHVTGDMAALVQKFAEKTRLGIPLLLGIDAVHGHAFWPGATVFPTQLAVASSWNRDLVKRMAHLTAREVAATGVHWTFSPVLELARDLRWGRVDETFGEDPYLAGELGAAMVTGYQGDSLSLKDSILACPKHFAGYCETQGGRDASEADLSRRKLLTYFLPPFRAAIEAGAAACMIAYQAIDGIPCTVNNWLLKTILKECWNFKGFTVTDWDNLGQMVKGQRVASTINEAAVMALKSGIDMAMTTPSFPDSIIEGVNRGIIPEALVDESCRRILSLKFELGLFDGRVYPDAERIKEVVCCREHREWALECACQSIVLLKNEGSFLPVKKDIRRIGVFGPNADDVDAQLGDFSFILPFDNEVAKKHPRENIVTILDGIRELAKGSVEFAKGCDVMGIEASTIEEAVCLAKQVDMAVVVVGDTLAQTGEEKSRANLDLSGDQEKLVESVASTGTPVVVVLINSKPLTIPRIFKWAPCIIEAWNPGMEGGRAIAAILFGARSPEGKLTVSFPHHVGQQPVYYNQLPGWHGRKYMDMPDTPLFAFGYGLSYTTYSYSNLCLSEKHIRENETLCISFDLKNTGDRDGTEIVQCYMQDICSSVTTPVKQLIRFQRVFLKAKEEKKISFHLHTDDLRLYNENLERVLEPGIFKIMAGPSSRDSDLICDELEVL